jgi:uncharacterized protein
MEGEVGHFEIPADDLARARKFYAETFGWKMVDVPGMEYAMVRTGKVNDRGMPTDPGYIGGGIAPRDKLLQHPLVVIVVEEITAAETLIEKNGGKVLRPKHPIGDGSWGFTAYFQDSEGNTGQLFQSPKR